MYISKIKYKDFDFDNPWQDRSVRFIDIVTTSLVELFNKICIEFDEKEYFYSSFSDSDERFYLYPAIKRDFLDQLRLDYVKVNDLIYVSRVNRKLILEKLDISYFYQTLVGNELDNNYIIINNEIVKISPISCYSNPCEFAILTERFHLLEPIKLFKNKKDASEFLRRMSVSK